MKTFKEFVYQVQITESKLDLKSDLTDILKKYKNQFSKKELDLIDALEAGAATFLDDEVTAQSIKKWVKESRPEAEENAEYFDMSSSEFEDLLDWVENNSEKLAQYFSNAAYLNSLEALIKKIK